VRGVRSVAVALCLVSLTAACDGTDSSSTSGANVAAPTISNLVISDGADRTLLFQVTATDPQGDMLGGTCNLIAAGFNVTGQIVPAPGSPGSATAAVIVCTVGVAPAFTGVTITGTISISDARGNTSNQLPFTTTLPQRRAGSL
jgi:hypothetical protein